MLINSMEDHIGIGAKCPPRQSTTKTSNSPALVVDLDGTLVKTDLLLESVLVLLKQHLWYLLLLPVWLLRGKAHLKYEVASRASLDPANLPYHEELLAHLREEHRKGRTVVLATATAIKTAEQVAKHLEIFDLVLGSDETTNLSGEAKRKCLVTMFGEKGFDYAGNDYQDFSVWSSARSALIVNPSRLVRFGTARMAAVGLVLDDRKKGFFHYVTPLRCGHWLKNLLVFVPLVAAHRVTDISLLGNAIVAFAAFGCFASSGYFINDLLDLQADRSHPRKRLRPFAAGNLSLRYALGMIPSLLVLGGLLAALVSPLFLAVASAYFVLTTAYSLFIKKLALLDVITLAGLYTLRIIGGAAAIAIWPSPWIFLFAVFLFFSLALVKRYSELVSNHVNARGYELSDQELLASMGVASGYVATFVLVLYLSTATAQTSHGRSPALWLLCPLLMYWISHIWLSAHRGKMPDDPVVFATSDWTSRIVLLVMFATIALGF